MGSAQVRLRVAYNTFKRNFGPINLASTSSSADPKTGEERETVRRPNLQPFLDDPDCWLVPRSSTTTRIAAPPSRGRSSPSG